MWIGMNIRFFLLAVNLVLLSGGMAANDARRTPVVRAVETVSYTHLTLPTICSV